jgi:hypothetical protein
MLRSQVLLLLVSLPLAGADQVPSPRTHISGAEVLNRYITATGGIEARRNLHTAEIQGAVNLFPVLRETGDDFRFYFSAPKRDVFEFEVRSHGQLTIGHDDGKEFARKTAGAVRMMNGVSADAMERNLLLLVESDWGKTAYKKIELAGVSKIDGRWVYAMHFEPQAGDPQVRYFDSETFLLIRIDQAQKIKPTRDGPEYAYKVETYLSDYKTTADFSLPRKILYRCSDGDLLLEIRDIKVNVPVDAAFARAKQP